MLPKSKLSEISQIYVFVGDKSSYEAVLFLINRERRAIHCSLDLNHKILGLLNVIEVQIVQNFPN